KGEVAMMKKKRFLSIIVIGLALFLSACSGGGDTDIAIGPPASETNSLSQAILEAYDIGEGDYTDYQEGFGDAADELQVGNIDISVCVLGMSAGNIVTFQGSTGYVRLLGLSDDVIEAVEQVTRYETYTIPSDT